MKRWLMLVPLAVLVTGCYSDKDGKALEDRVDALEEWAKQESPSGLEDRIDELEEWATAESLWSLEAYEKFRILYGDSIGPPPALVQEVQEKVMILCKMMDNVDDAECDKLFDPGPGDTTSPPPPKKYPPK